MDVPATTLLNTFSKGLDKSQFEKTAALFDDRIKEIVPQKDKAYIQVISTGAHEFYGANNNGDAFNESARSYTFPHPAPGVEKVAHLNGGLLAYHDKTFMSQGAVYKNHVNRNKKAKPSGHIKFAAYNPDMHRGELILELDVNKWGKELEKVAKEEPIYFSMGCSTPADLCSYCGHRAATRDDSCDHLKHNMLSMDKEGNQTFAITDVPLFHDISGVFRPADKIAFGLRKVASDGFMTGVELAELEGLTVPVSYLRQYMNKKASDRQALLHKLAAIEKEVMLSTGGPDCDMKDTFAKEEPAEIPENIMNKLQTADPGDVFGALKHRSIILPIEEFMKLIAGNDMYKDEVEPVIDHARSMLPGIFGRLLEGDTSSMLEDGSYEPHDCIRDHSIEPEVDSLISDHSLEHRPMTMRVMRISLKPKPKKRVIIKVASEKIASADFIAREYAKYQLSFLEGSADNYITRLTLAQNASNV
jgi:hypothetical protein